MSEVNPDQFFNLDEASKEAEDNVYAEFEQTLNLPVGSTKEAIEASKDLISKTKALSVQASMLEFKENSIDNIDAEEIDDEVLKKDRARIRKEAHELYDMGKNMLTYMYDQVKSQIDPDDKMWASMANMISSVTKSLNDLNKMTKEFREENDKYIEKKVQSGEIDATEQEFDFSPEQANRIIATWTKQNESTIIDQVKQEVEDREKARIGVDQKQIENKAET